MAGQPFPQAASCQVINSLPLIFWLPKKFLAKAECDET